MDAARRAPIAGTLAEASSLKVGGMVQLGDRICTIVPDGVLKVVALSGGYSRADANKKLAAQHGMIASFSRALTEGLTAQQSDAQFDAALDAAIESIYQASRT